MLNMASSEQGFMFGEFDDLSPEEHSRIYNILHGQKTDSANKVEFPWKDEDDEITGAVGGSVCSSKNWSDETIEFVGTPDDVYRPLNEGYQISFLSNESHLDQPESYNNSSYPSSDARFQVPPPAVRQYPMQGQYMPPSGGDQKYMQHGMESQNRYDDRTMTGQYGGDQSDAYVDRAGSNSKLQASLKPYERRNKKKRPPDYYKQQQSDNSGSPHQHSVRLSMNNEHVQYDLSQPPPNFHPHFNAPPHGLPPGINATPPGINAIPPGINPNNYSMNQPGYNIHSAPIQQMDVHCLPQQTYDGANQQYNSTTGRYTGTVLHKNGGSIENHSQNDHNDLREVVIHSTPQNSSNIPTITNESYQNVDHGRSRTSSANYHIESNAVQKDNVTNYQVNPSVNMPPNNIVYQSHLEFQSRNSGIDTSMQLSEDAGGVLESSQGQSNVVVENNTPVASISSTEDSDSNLINKNQTSDISYSIEPTSVEIISKTNYSDVQTDPVQSAPDMSKVEGQTDKVINEQSVQPPAPQQTVSEPSAPAVKKPVSWAGLFKSNSANSTQVFESPVPAFPGDNSAGVVINSSDLRDDKEPSPAPVLASEDSAAKDLGEHLAKMSISHASVALQPRGLVNRANWCYINGTLQALVACPPFYYLLKKLPKYPGRGPSSTPILDAMVEFINEFQPMSRSFDKGHKGTRELSPGVPFEPSNVYKMLQAIAVNPHFKLGKQEDAEEFLSCILDGMHEEMSAAVNLNSDNIENQVTDIEIEDGLNGYVHAEGDDMDGEPEEDSWEQVGPKKKSVLTRRANFAKTPIADIFAGMLRSAVYKTSAKETATLEPFFTLQLDIQSDKVWSVKDALEGFVSKEQIMGYTCSNTKSEVEVSKKLSLEELPPVLILHLKFFVYNKDGGCQKILKKLDYGVELEITKDLLSPSARNKLNLQQRSYKLFAVVYHHGKKTTGGHYTTSVFHPGINGWIHSDDSTVKTVNVSSVLKYVPPRVPYLLYYRRLDSH